VWRRCGCTGLTRVAVDARERRDACAHELCGPPAQQGGGGVQRVAAPLSEKAVAV